MILALFDFDGTVTRKDSMIDFMQYAVSKPRYYFNMLVISPVLILFKLGLIPNHIAKEKLIGMFFNGWQSSHFKNVANAYSLERLNKIIRPAALEKIRWHLNEGHKVVIVSASLECWLMKWCESQSVDLIATRLEIQNGKLTGKFASKNCHGREKVNRITALYDLTNFSDIYAYGDSSGDKEMLAIATKPFYKYFH